MDNEHKEEDEYQGEEWRPVLGYEGYYEVSNYARVRNVATGRRRTPGAIKKPSVTNGRYVVRLYKDCVGKTKQLDRIVYASWVQGTYKVKLTHKDGDLLNCEPDNLLDQKSYQREICRETTSDFFSLHREAIAAIEKGLVKRIRAASMIFDANEVVAAMVIFASVNVITYEEAVEDVLERMGDQRADWIRGLKIPTEEEAA